jgi:TP901 family phage tail tape measure protein
MTATARIRVAAGNAPQEIAKLAQAAKEVATASTAAAQGLTNLEKAAGAGTTRVRSASRGMKEVADSAAKVDGATRRAASGTKKLEEAAAAVTPKVTRAVASTTSYARASTSMATASKAASDQIKRSTLDTIDFTRAADKATNAVQKLAAANRRVSNPFNRQGGAGSITPRVQTNRFDRALDSINTFTDRYGGNLSMALGAARVTALGLGTALVGVGGGLSLAVREASELDTAMSRVRAAAMASREEMGRLRTQASELGASTQFSAAEVGRVQENYAKAGFSVDEMIAGVPAALALAGATDTDTGFSSGLLSQVIRSIGFEASDSGMISDNLVTAANVSNVDVTDLAETMKYAAPIFANMSRGQQGTAFRDLSALSGILGDQGIRGSMAGTGLRTGYLALASPTRRASRALEGLGVDPIDQATGDVRRLPSILGDLRDALADKDSGEQSRALRDIFGAEGAGTFAAILASDASRFDELVSAMEASEGAAERTARVMQDNLAGDIERLGGSLGGLGTTIGSQMLPGIRNATQSLGDFIDAINGAAASGDEGGGVFKELGDDIADTIDGFRLAMERFLPPLLGALESLGVVEPGTAADMAGRFAEANTHARIGRVDTQAATVRDQIQMDYTRAQQALGGVRGRVSDAEGSTGANLAADVRRRLEGAGQGDLASMPAISQLLGELSGREGPISSSQRREVLGRITRAMTPAVEDRQRVALEERDRQLSQVDAVEGRSVEEIERYRERARQGARGRASTAASGEGFGDFLGGVGVAFGELGARSQSTAGAAQARTSDEAERHLATLAQNLTPANLRRAFQEAQPPTGTGPTNPQ